MKSIVWTTPHLRNGINTKDIELYHKTMVIPGLSVSCWHVDRTSTIVLPFKTQLKDVNKIPNLSKPAKSLEDCLNQTSDRILNANQQIYLMWSGGIDSTLMVLSFVLRSNKDNKISVVLNQDSIRENPNFYKKIIKPNFNIESTEHFVRRLTHTQVQGITLQAEHADLLTFNENPFERKIKQHTDLDLLDLPNNLENTQLLLTFLDIDNNAAECFHDLMMTTANSAGVNLSKIKHLFWWYNFNFRWQNNREKFRSRINPKNSYETFYSSEDFQLWSVKNLEKNLNLKNEFKQIIKTHFDDREYVDHKIKWSSMSKHFATDSAYAVTYDDELLEKQDIKIQELYQEDNFFTNWIDSKNNDK